MKLVHDPRVLLALLLSLGPPSGEHPAGANEQEPIQQRESDREIRGGIRGGWFALRPAGLALSLGERHPDTRRFAAAVGPSYRWGFSAGASFEPSPGLLLNVAAGVDQTLWSFRSVAVPEGSDEPTYTVCFRGDCYGWTERIVGSLFRVGLELRIGYVARRWLVWASLEPQLAAARVRLICFDSRAPHCERKSSDVGVALTGSVAGAWRVVPRFALGLEAELGQAWLDRRDDPFRAARSVELGLIAVLRF